MSQEAHVEGLVFVATPDEEIRQRFPLVHPNVRTSFIHGIAEENGRFLRLGQLSSRDGCCYHYWCGWP